MSWLTPLGFLGFIGIIVLIIIYIIKPNYQNKIISSTFVWKLSLRYRKKKIPLSKLRNILLLICQLLIITAITGILAQPFIKGDDEDDYSEKVVIIDASASMLTETGGETRFERAVEMVQELSEDVVKNNARLTVILAGEKASYVLQESYDANEINMALDDLLLSDPKEVCTYGTPDMTGAIELAESITAIYPKCDVVLYSDTTYLDAGKITVVPVVDISEYNASILDVRAIIDENYYRVEIDVACYGLNAPVMVNCDIYGANLEGATISFSNEVLCEYDKTKTLVYALKLDENSEQNPDIIFGDELSLYSFDNIHVSVAGSADAFPDDDSFYLYGGEKIPLRVQYYSALPNSYFGTAMLVLRDALSDRWNVEFKEVKREETPELVGFDVYIFEHAMPNTVPTDGIVLLFNPDGAPAGTDFGLGRPVGFQEEYSLSSDAEALAHPIMNNITPESITVTQYTPITHYNGYDALLYAENSPVLIAKNEPFQKIAVMSFSLNYSNLAMLLEFPLMIYNMFEYFSPSTFEGNVFDINEEISLNSRSDMLTVNGGALNDLEIVEFPDTIKVSRPGVYTVTQVPISGEAVVESFYVKLPAEESNIYYEEDVLVNPAYYEVTETNDIDLLLYFAIALVALLFAEWWLHSREQF